MVIFTDKSHLRYILVVYLKRTCCTARVPSPTPLWKMAKVPSERPTRTRPFTCLQERNKNQLLHIQKSSNMKKWPTCLKHPSFISMYLHYAEHRVLQLYRMEALLPLSHRGVDVHTGIRNVVSIIRLLVYIWPFT